MFIPHFNSQPLSLSSELLPYFSGFLALFFIVLLSVYLRLWESPKRFIAISLAVIFTCYAPYCISLYTKQYTDTQLEKLKEILDSSEQGGQS